MSARLAAATAWVRARWAAGVRWLIAAVLTVLAFGPSLRHLHDAAADFGATGWVAWSTAASVDLLAVYAGLVLRERHRAGQRTWDALLILAVTVATTIAGQVVTAQATIGGVFAAVWPAACFLAVMTLIEFAPDRRPTRARAAGQSRVKPQASAPVTRPATPELTLTAPSAVDPAAEGQERVTLHSVPGSPDPTADPAALTVEPGESRADAVARWVREDHPHGVMVKAIQEQFGVGLTTAKNAIRDARQAVA